MLTARWIGVGPCDLLMGVFFIAPTAAAAYPYQAEVQELPMVAGEAGSDSFATQSPNEAGPGVQATPSQQENWLRRLTRQNFTFKYEVLSQFTYGYKVDDDALYSRQSGGFEMLKKFSTATATIAAFDLQFRLVRRDHWLPVLNDTEGMNRDGFFPEYHNVYLDFYNVFNPLMSDSARSRHIGRFNLRMGRFYLPFGINLQTDTHATVLQLSNDRNFGFDRDWYTGFYGSLTRDVNYDVYYLLGSGYYPRFKGQRGLFGARVSLGNRFLNEHGVEGGVAFMGGERISHDAVMRSPSVAAKSLDNNIVRTLRLGLDGRYTHPLSSGTLAFTTELSGGHDESDGIFTNLNQVEFLSRSRKCGWAVEYRHFRQDIHPAPEIGRPEAPNKVDSSVAAELTYYFRNDIGSTKLHWLKFHIERNLGRQEGDRLWLFTVQYYLYW